MDIPKLSVGAWIGIVVNIIALIGGLVGLWVKVESKISEIAIENTKTVAGIFVRDLRARITLIETEIDELVDNNVKVPQVKRYHLRILKEELDDLRKWSAGENGE